jgi:hypothetical protein
VYFFSIISREIPIKIVGKEWVNFTNSMEAEEGTGIGF